MSREPGSEPPWVPGAITVESAPPPPSRWHWHWSFPQWRCHPQPSHIHPNPPAGKWNTSTGAWSPSPPKTGCSSAGACSATSPLTTGLQCVPQRQASQQQPITGRSNYVVQGADSSDQFSVAAVTNGHEQTSHHTGDRLGHRPPGPPAEQASGRGTPWTASPTPTTPTTPASATSTATGSTRSFSSGIRPIPRTTPSPGTPARCSSTPTNSTVPSCGASRWDATSAPARTTARSWSMTSTVTGGPRWSCAPPTAPSTARGAVIGDATADYRNRHGYILSGPEFLTVFNGRTGGDDDQH